MNSSRFKSLLRLLEPFIGILVVLGLFAMSPVRDTLFSGGSWNLILLQTVVVALGAMGMTMIIISGGIDLSAGSTVALTCVVGATLILQGMALPWVMICCVLVGGAVGFVNGMLIAGLRMVPFIVTLGMMGIDASDATPMLFAIVRCPTVGNPPQVWRSVPIGSSKITHKAARLEFADQDCQTSNSVPLGNPVDFKIQVVHVIEHA